MCAASTSSFSVWISARRAVVSVPTLSTVSVSTTILVSTSASLSLAAFSASMVSAWFILVSFIKRYSNSVMGCSKFLITSTNITFLFCSGI